MGPILTFEKGLDIRGCAGTANRAAVTEELRGVSAFPLSRRPRAANPVSIGKSLGHRALSLR